MKSWKNTSESEAKEEKCERKKLIWQKVYIWRDKLIFSTKSLQNTEPKLLEVIETGLLLQSWLSRKEMV